VPDGHLSTFLGSAKGRLLAASIPFRFFGAAIVFHFVAWLALLAGAADLPRFAGGPGPVLAALHLLTLGVLAMSAIGASLQLLPVATRQPVSAATHAPAAIWWLYTPGVAALALGMGAVIPALAAAGAVAVVLALIGFALLLARNLRARHGRRGGGAWLGRRAVAVGAGQAVTGRRLRRRELVATPRRAGPACHVCRLWFHGSAGDGLLLHPCPCLRWRTIVTALVASLGGSGLVALGLALLSALAWLPPASLGVGIGLGALALAIHVALMLQALRGGMRRNLGASFVLVRIGWAALLASLAVALAREFGALPVLGAGLFGLLLLGGLLTLLLGVLSRIVPFLASMHAAAGARRAPTPSSLTAQRPLDIHFYCHLAAMLGLLLAVLVQSVWLVRASALVGLAGAVAFGVFFVTAWRVAQVAPPG
jgi:hypothetical protein